ncbi:MAG TPA: lytic transglycosylase domain-containing protein [Blastocatellia bacterium]|nr:lytic transglycosylase domain-containing protein [Blastocatellia bacterium]
MNNNPSPFSNPVCAKLKTLFARKLFSTALATAFMALALWGVSSLKSHGLTVPEPSEAEVAVSAEPTVDLAPMGLSRQRKDFDRALELLAGAATSDNTLAQYFERVQKRVKGEVATPEKGSGVRTVTPRKRAGAASDQAGATGVTARVVEKVKGYVAPGMVAEAKPSSGGDAGVEAGGAARLTVGDIVYEKNPAIEKWVSYYTTNERGRRTMEVGINRSDAYLKMARAEFRRVGVPEDLVWLAFVESVWHPGAMSPAAAGGIWQFIPKTATEYGLTVSDGNDERFDPMKQTKVAAAYLRDLYTIFGDWTLAMAAYNCGEPRVMDAVIKNGRANFWDLHTRQLLPQETRNYVPKILAAIEVASKAQAYGFVEDSARAVETDAAYAGR